MVLLVSSAKSSRRSKKYGCCYKHRRFRFRQRVSLTVHAECVKRTFFLTVHSFFIMSKRPTLTESIIIILFPVFVMLMLMHAQILQGKAAANQQHRAPRTDRNQADSLEKGCKKAKCHPDAKSFPVSATFNWYD